MMNYLFLEKTTVKNLSCLFKNNEIINLKLFLLMYKGFEIRYSKLITFDDYNSKFIYLQINFQFCYFQFYRKSLNLNKLLNESSSVDLLTNYYNITRNNLNKVKNISALFLHFPSLFANYNMSILFNANTFINNKLSKLLFKENQIYKLQFFRFTNNSLRKHFMDFNQDDDLFYFNDLEEILLRNKTFVSNGKTKVKLNSQIRILYLFDIYHLNLTESIIDKHVFRRIVSLQITGSFLNINDFTFQAFQ